MHRCTSCLEGAKHITTYAVSIEGLRVRRGGHEVLRNLSVSIPASSITGLIGPSGCGKSTLMRAILGIQVIHAGRISVLGLEAGNPALRRRIGYATQTPAVYSDLTVRENLHYFASMLGAPADDTNRVMDEVDLGKQSNQQVSKLSGGQLSRVSLAVALLGEPQLLVLDEPTVGLDPVLRNELWDLFHSIGPARGVTLLVSSHVMDEATRCEQLILMRDGVILTHETPDALRARTGAQDLEQAFLRLVRDTGAEGLET